MQRLLKFLHLKQRDRLLLIKTALLLGTIRLGLWLLPFQTLRELLARITPTTSELEKTQQASVSRVVWAVNVVSRFMPGEVKCLARALATQALLRKYGYQAQLCIGVAKSEEGKLEAHAWIENQGRVVVGGLKDLARFTPLSNLEVKKS